MQKKKKKIAYLQQTKHRVDGSDVWNLPEDNSVHKHIFGGHLRERQRKRERARSSKGSFLKRKEIYANQRSRTNRQKRNLNDEQRTHKKDRALTLFGVHWSQNAQNYAATTTTEQNVYYNKTVKRIEMDLSSPAVVASNCWYRSATVIVVHESLQYSIPYVRNRSNVIT